MSLDVYLIGDPETHQCQCDCGHWHTKQVQSELYTSNITHNLGCMADAAGIYKHLWRPEEIGITRARQLVEPLTRGLVELRKAPESFRQYDAPNGWGKYENLVNFVEEYICACEANPDANVTVSR